jgi:hypothetical protein
MRKERSSDDSAPHGTKVRVTKWRAKSAKAQRARHTRCYAAAARRRSAARYTIEPITGLHLPFQRRDTLSDDIFADIFFHIFFAISPMLSP